MMGKSSDPIMESKRIDAIRQARARREAIKRGEIIEPPPPEERTARRSGFTQAEVHRIQAETGLVFKGTTEVGGKFLDRQYDQRGKPVDVPADAGMRMLVPIFGRPE